MRTHPTHWSQLIAGITAASLVMLVLTDVYLALHFDPSMARVRYDGPFGNLRGVDMTRAYASVLHMSFEVRGGLLIRQIHSWASSLFLASLLVHLCVMFFTGGFRRPRRLLWTKTLLLLITGIFAAFTDTLLTGDVLSDASLRMISGYTRRPLGDHVHAARRIGRRPAYRTRPARLPAPPARHQS